MIELNSANPLKGEINVPGDKSISHRAIMLGSLATGTTRIHNFLESADCIATIHCFRKMGIDIEREHHNPVPLSNDNTSRGFFESNATIVIQGKGLHGLTPPEAVLNVGNSGTTARLLAGILAGQPFRSEISGDSSLNSRPMNRIITPLKEMNARITSILGNDCAPLAIGANKEISLTSQTWTGQDDSLETPKKLRGINYHSPVASAQVKSCLLFAGLYADGVTSITEPYLSRNHTELMLKEFGAHIRTTWDKMSKDSKSNFALSYHHEFKTDGSRSQPTAILSPSNSLAAQEIIVPGDISSAAFFIAAGLVVPNSEILIKNVGVNPTRRGILQVCQKMDGNVILGNERVQNGELVADILVKSSLLKGTTIEGEIIPTLIDEIPIIAVMAALAEGQTVIKDASELKIKESNRIDTVVFNLKNMGADIIATDDGLIIHGGKTLNGTLIQSYHDHRIAMAFSIAALVAKGSTKIMDSHCVNVSYPSFFDTLNSLL